ncbi:MAG: ATP-dependent protease, partial [Candidatus Fraserbacteria bacterium RBG_16_55_9]
MNRELTPKQLRRVFAPRELGCETTEDHPLLTGIIGQERAVKALRFGLDIQAVGFNTYVAGLPGIGKMTAIQAFLEEFAKQKETPPDWCYANNFAAPDQPKVLKLPAGRGRELQRDLKHFIDQARREIPKAFDSEEYNSRREEIAKGLNQQREAVLQRLNTRATQAGFTLQGTPLGVMVVPVLGGRPLSDAEFLALPASAREDLESRREQLQEELKVAMKQAREFERAAQVKLQELDQQVVLFVVGGLIEDLFEKYKDLPEIGEHLQALQKDIQENIEVFKGSSTSAQPSSDGGPAMPWLQDLPFRKYQVHVLVGNSEQQGAPVVLELNPSHSNLFGRIEKETLFGALYTDFTMIQDGALHRANGGYLILPAEDVLNNLFSWDGLKRALRSREIQIEEMGERLGYIATKSLRPQPIPLDVKVILVGHPSLYYLLHSYDEEFPELFKVKADFDTRMDCTEENIRDFISFLCTLCQKEKLRHLDASAIGKMLEYAARRAEDQEKLSTHFGAMADLVREANFWAAQQGSAYVTDVHIQRALEEKVYRSSLLHNRIQEMMSAGTILIDTMDRAVGQVNGLSVIHLGDYEFGRPVRITASVGPGREGIIDIEREVELGGPIHSKGVMILSGYLSHKYAQGMPLSLGARLVFEQSYEGIEGDSASSTELYALLSALSGLPIKQSIAVTGSVNQHGQIQPIGGVNEKIESFFELCNAKGLTGDQGVMIPASNVRHLMLREDVVEVARSGKFHVWAVSTIDEGMEVLTGIPAGERGSNGKFPKNTVNFRVDQRLRKMAESLHEPPEEGVAQRMRAKAP